MGENKNNESEEWKFFLRLKLFFLWIIFRAEKNILIISNRHAHFNLQDEGFLMLI